MKPLLLDLFCCAGGAGTGYSRAGFEVVGVDINPQPRYPFEFHRANALEYLDEHGHKFDVIHASPPCQGYSNLRHISKAKSIKNNPLLIDPVRYLLKKIGKPYIIENVESAPLENPIMLCGTMFGMKTTRHRLFETNPPLWFPPSSCNHSGELYSVLTKSCRPAGDLRSKSSHNLGKSIMGIDWMTQYELGEAIPPVYTEWIGKKIMACLTKHAPDKWESVPSTGIVPPSRLSTSQSESTPPTCG